MYSQSNGQAIDTIAHVKKKQYGSLIVPAALITSGALLLHTKLNVDLQEKSQQLFGKNFNSQLDNLFPLVPIAQLYAGRYLGFEPKNTIAHQTTDLISANLATLIVVEVVKHIVKEERPDQSDNLSFPSGHSAIAFTNATLLFNEYKDANFWYASSGFVFATATGMFRIANNKHYTSDVLTGAGIGLASGLLVSYYNPFRALHSGKNKKQSTYMYPTLGNQIGIGAIINPDF